VLLAFAFGAQALASVFAFLSRDGGAGTALAQLALVWLVLGTTMLLLEPGETSDALGVFLVFAGVSLLLSGAVTATGKLVPAAVFALAGIRFLTAAVYELSSSEIWEDVSGVVGLVLALLAIYAASAVQLEEALGRPVLPLGRRGRGRIALRGSLLEQVKEAPNAPGVRVQL
jgi:hypothetical protein